MKISKTISIDMGHRLPNHKSKCRSLHGHRYKFEAIVSGELIRDQGTSSSGMIIDFGDLKAIMMEVIDEKYDHGFMMYEGDPFTEAFRQLQFHWDQKIIFVDFIPTVENIAIHVFKELDIKLKEKWIDLIGLKVWETPTSVAHVKREDIQ